MKGRFFYKCVLVVMVITLVLSCSNDSVLLPKDEVLINNFKKNKFTFEKFVKIFLTNQGLYHIQAFSKESGTPLTLNIDDLGKLNRVEMFTEMKDKLQVSVVAGNSFKDIDLGSLNEISFYAFRSGIVSSGGKIKGISYFVFTPPQVLEDSLDKFDPPQNKPFPSSKEPSVRVYSKIEDGWYLFVEESK